MKLPLRAVVAALALALAAPAPGAPSCRLPGGRTLVADRFAKLIALPTPDGRALYACIRRSGRKVALDLGFSDARLSSHWVAWQRRSGGKWRIYVHDLRSGGERLVDGHAAVHALLVTSSGTAVWAQRLGPDVGVFANDARSGGRLLGRGTIAPRSLRLAGRRVSWRQDGGEQTAVVR